MHKAKAPFAWTRYECKILEEMAATGHTAREIATRFGVSRNAVIGKAFRMGFEFKSKDGKRRSARRNPVKTISAPGLAKLRKTIELMMGAETKGEPKLPPPPKPVRIPGVPIPLIDLEFRDCRWPVADDDRGVPSLYCGKRHVIGTSYCPEHLAMAFRPVKKKLVA